jgi:glutaconyl-CoA/methylmalonyl-CoA decarboxylase subunit gamma
MKYNVSINGKKYEVEVERADGVTASAPVQQNAAAPQAASAGSEIVRSPMPGTIVDVKVSVGQQIKKGQVLVVLEAMKMENEIVADRDGVVESIAVTKGANINSNDALLALK